MAVQFVIGRAGSGKTHRCLTSIVDALRADPLGPPVYWIVPKQATFMTERALTCAAGAFCRARVVSFEQLGREVFAYAGGNVIPEVTPLGRQMVIGHLLRQLKPQLRFFAGSARQPGLAAELDAAFAEFERSGKTADELATLVDELATAKPVDVDHVSLLAKLRDLRLVYDAYAKYLGQGRLDQHQRLQQVLGCLDGCPPLRGATVYVDGFTEFSRYEGRLLAGLAKVCARMEVMLLMDPASPVARDPHTLPDDAGLFRQTEQTYRRLWFGFAEQNVAVGETVRLDAAHRFIAPALTRVERALFTDGPESPVAATPGSPPAPGVCPPTACHPDGSLGRPEGSRSGPALPHDQIPQVATAPPGMTTLPDPGHPPEATQASQLQRGIELVVAPDRQAEVDAAARGIRKLWREGYRLRDVAVLVRDVEPYHALIDASFREHGIGYFVDRRRSAAHHPLLQFVRAFFQVVRFEWPNEPAVALLKCGLAGVTPAEADEVENYVALHHVRGLAWERPEPWACRRRLTLAEDEAPAAERPENVDQIRRRVADRLRPSASVLRLHESLTVREVMTELFTVLERFGVRATLAAWAEASARANPEQAAEHEQVWAEFVDLCDQMVDLLGGERVTLVDFVDVLESGLERFDLALTPPTVDQVLVGQVDRTRCPPGLKAAFVLGLNEGEFPRVARESSVLTEPERRELRRRRVELDPDRRQALRDEDLLGYVAFTRASQRLIVSRTRADDDGREVAPSRYWDRLRELFPGATPVEIPRDARGDTSLLETPRQVIVGLLRWARSPGRHATAEPTVAATPASQPQAGEGPWPALYAWLAAYPAVDDAVARMRRLAWRAIGYANEATLSAGLAARLFGAPLEATARQLETFAACPFKHFAQHGLGLAGRPAGGVGAADLSQVYHKVLDIVVAEVLERRADWAQLGSVVTREMIRSYAEVVGQTLRGELMLSTARNKYLLGRVERTLEEVVASQAEMMRRGQFRPSFTSVQFGEQGRLPALRVGTPAGRDVVVRGGIDRVDLLPGGEHAAVFDYKFGKAAVSMQDVYHGTSLQLLTYLLVLQASGEELAGRPLTPVAAFYLPLVRGIREVEHPDKAPEPTEPKFHLRAKPRGVFEGEYLPAFDAAAEKGAWSDVVNAFVNKEGYLGHRGSSDVADAAEFAALLAYVRRRLGELADGVVSGRVAVEPYRINRRTPCPGCEYRSVCRFEPSINRYANLEAMRREAALAKMAEEDARGD